MNGAALTRAGALLVLALAAGCSSVPREAAPARSPLPPRGDATPAPPAATPIPQEAPRPRPGARPSRGGGFYQNDGPGDDPPPGLHLIPDAVPRAEPLHRAANRPYTVFGRR